MIAAARRGWDRFRQGIGPAYLVAVLGALVAVNRWFVRGAFVSTGDMGPFIRDGWRPEVLSSWGHNTTGAGSASYVIARWYDFVLTDGVHALGGSDMLAQRLFYCTAYGLVAFGVAAFAAGFTRSRTAVAFAGLLGVFNGFFLTRLPNPLNIVSIASCALVGAVLVRAANGKRLPGPLLALAVLPMSFLSFNPPMLTVALAWTALGAPLLIGLTLGWRAAARALGYGLRAAPWVIGLNLFWLVPFAQAFTGGGGAVATAQTDATAWAWSQAQNFVPNVLTLSANWAWTKPQYLPFAPALDRPSWIWVRYLLPMAVFAAPLLVRPRKRRPALVLLLAVLVFTLLAKGLQPPFSGFNLFLYQHAPGFWLFREPMSKLGQLIVLFDAVLLALAIEGLQVRLPAMSASVRPVARTAAASIAVLILAWPYPLITGAVIPDVRPLQPSAHVRVPAYWRATAKAIDADPRPGKVLVLPLDDYYQMPTTWGFFGVDSIAGLLLRHPVVQRHPDGYFGDAPGFAAQVDATERALVAGDLDAVPNLLASMGVSTVIVRHDLRRDQPGRTFADDRVLAKAVARTPGLRQARDGTLEVWKVTAGTSPEVRAQTAPLLLPPEPASTAAAVASLDPAQAVLPDGEQPVPLAPTVARPAGAASATDGAYWPVEAVTAGDASTTFTTTGGRYQVAQRARAGAVLVPREEADPASASGRSLVLHDPTSLLVDGTAVAGRPDATYPISRSGVTAVRAGNRTISLDRWIAPSLPPSTTSGAAGAPTVVVGAATPLAAFAPARRPSRTGDPSSVFDCNNYEPRPASELGLSANVLTGADGVDVVRLSAKDHAACSSLTVRGLAAGETVRLRLESRSVVGKRPAVCLLQLGLDRCAPDARLSAGTDWARHEQIVTLEPGTTGVQVVLYANVGTRLAPPTTSEYRSVTVERLEPVLRTTAWPEPVPSTSMALPAGTHRLTVTGGASGSALADFEDLQDCFRYDDQSIDQAGLEARTFEGDDGASVIELKARAHMACLGATIPDFGASSLYTLQYDYRSINLRKARVCLFQRGPDACAPLPANGAETTWTTYSTPVRPTLPAVETRLYLYGSRDLEERDQAVVQYRRVRVTPVATPSAVVVTRDVTVPEPPVVTTTKQSPTRYGVTVEQLDEGTVVGLAETWAPGWIVEGLPAGAEAEHVRLDGWANGWRITGLPADAGPVAFTIRYRPARVARAALLISLATVPAAAAWWFLAPVLLGRLRRRFPRVPGGGA